MGAISGAPILAAPWSRPSGPQSHRSIAPHTTNHGHFQDTRSMDTGRPMVRTSLTCCLVTPTISLISCAPSMYTVAAPRSRQLSHTRFRSAALTGSTTPP